MGKKQLTAGMKLRLRDSFPAEAYQAHSQKEFLTTLKAAYIYERINEVFGVGRWTFEVVILKQDEIFVLMEGKFNSLDYDIDVPKQFGGHRIGKGSDFADAFKSAKTDAFTKCVSQLDVGHEVFKGLIAGDGSKKKFGNTKKPVVNKLQNEIDKKKQTGQKPPKQKVLLTEEHPNFIDCVQFLAGGGDMDKLRARFNITLMLEKYLNKCAVDLVADQFFKEQQRQG